MKIIPYGRQFIDKSDINAVKKTLTNDLITTGKEVIKFEKLFSKKVGVKYSVSCSSGTAALLLSYLALGIKKNDIILTPSINFIASVNMAEFINAKIYLTDVDPITGQMRPEDLINCINKNRIKKINTVVIMHNGGKASNMSEFFKLKKKYNFNIIEDACHALGAKYSFKKNDNVGNCKYSDISVFSFHPLKHITTGEGGIVTTNNKMFYEKLKIFRSHGILRNRTSSKKYSWNYDTIAPGFNFRLSDIQCALGSNQLKKLDLFVNERQNIAKMYKKKLNDLRSYLNFDNDSKHMLSSYHLFIINLKINKIKISRDDLIKKLFRKKIITQVHYIPIFKFSYYRKLYKKNFFNNALKYFRSSISIPIYFGLKEKEINHICLQLKKYIK